jgi:hypothetical protein
MLVTHFLSWFEIQQSHWLSSWPNCLGAEQSFHVLSKLYEFRPATIGTLKELGGGVSSGRPSTWPQKLYVHWCPIASAGSCAVRQSWACSLIWCLLAWRRTVPKRWEFHIPSDHQTINFTMSFRPFRFFG